MCKKNLFKARIIFIYRMNTIEEDNHNKFLKYFEKIPHPSYVAGFIDGDGSISIFKIKGGYNTRI